MPHGPSYVLELCSLDCMCSYINCLYTAFELRHHLSSFFEPLISFVSRSCEQVENVISVGAAMPSAKSKADVQADLEAALARITLLEKALTAAGVAIP